MKNTPITVQWKFLGIDYALLTNREWNQKQKNKKQPWSNVECFAFGCFFYVFVSVPQVFIRLSGKLVGIGVYFSKSVQEELFVHYSPE